MANTEPFFVEHWKLSHFFSSWEGWASNDYCKELNIFKNRVNHGEKAKINFLPLFLPLKESRLLTEHCYAKPERPLDQHGGGELEEEMHVVLAMDKHMRDFWTGKNVSVTWHLMLLVPGLKSSRMRANETGAVSYTVCILSNSQETKIH